MDQMSDLKDLAKALSGVTEKDLVRAFNKAKKLAEQLDKKYGAALEEMNLKKVSKPLNENDESQIAISDEDFDFDPLSLIPKDELPNKIAFTETIDPELLDEDFNRLLKRDVFNDKKPLVEEAANAVKTDLGRVARDAGKMAEYVETGTIDTEEATGILRDMVEYLDKVNDKVMTESIALRWKKLGNGDLEVSLQNKKDAEDIDLEKDFEDNFEYLIQNGMDWVFPQEVGSLTDSPMFGETERDDHGNLITTHSLYWYPDYQISDPAEVLKTTGKVVFKNGNGKKGKKEDISERSDDPDLMGTIRLEKEPSTDQMNRMQKELDKIAPDAGESEIAITYSDGPAVNLYSHAHDKKNAAMAVNKLISLLKHNGFKIRAVDIGGSETESVIEAAPKSVPIKPGEEGEAVMPSSEVMMHMKVAGKKMKFKFLENGRMVQLMKDDHPFSGPVTYGEAGIYRNDDGTFYYYPDFNEDITLPSPGSQMGIAAQTGGDTSSRIESVSIRQTILNEATSISNFFTPNDHQMVRWMADYLKKYWKKIFGDEIEKITGLKFKYDFSTGGGPDHGAVATVSMTDKKSGKNINVEFEFEDKQGGALLKSIKAFGPGIPNTEVDTMEQLVKLIQKQSGPDDHGGGGKSEDTLPGAGGGIGDMGQAATFRKVGEKQDDESFVSADGTVYEAAKYDVPAKVKASTISVLGGGESGLKSVNTYVEVTNSGGKKGTANLTMRFDRGDKAWLAGYPNDWKIYDEDADPYGDSEDTVQDFIDYGGELPKGTVYVSKETEQEIFRQLKKSLEKQFKDPMFKDHVPEDDKKRIMGMVDKAIENPQHESKEHGIDPSLTEFLGEADPSLAPPKKWFQKMYKQVHKSSPSYSDEKVRATIGDIWYHNLSPEKRKEIRGREGKRYGKSESTEFNAESVISELRQLLPERKLTSKQKKDLPDSAFVYPKERKYPIHDLAHAKNALARSSGKPEEKKVRAAVYKKYPKLKKKGESLGEAGGTFCSDQEAYCDNETHNLAEGASFDDVIEKEEMEKFLKQFPTLRDQVEETEEGFKLKPEKAKDLERTFKLFTEGEDADKSIELSENHVKEHLMKLANKFKPASGAFDPGKLEIVPEFREFDNYVGSDAASISFTVSYGDQEEEFEPSALYYSGAHDSISDSFIPTGWDWATWLMADDSPYHDDDFVEAYAHSQVAQALEQFSATLNESDIDDEFMKLLGKFNYEEETEESVTEMEDPEDEPTEPDEEDIVFSPTGQLGAQTLASVHGFKSIGTFNDDDEAWEAAHRYMKKTNVYPNVWNLSDHGNYHLISKEFYKKYKG